MKVGINVFCTNNGKSGVGSYIYSLVNSISKLQDKGNYPEINFELFGSELQRFTFDSNCEKITYQGVHIKQSTSAEWNFHLFKLKNFVKKNKYDFVIYPAGAKMLPYSFSVPSIPVVNEVLSLSLKNNKSHWQKKCILYGLKKAYKVIASSQFIKKDLVKLGIKIDKIEVIHNGIDHNHFYPHEAISNDTILIKPFTIKKPYIVYATSIQNKEKKHAELIKAFEVFKEKSNLPHRLVLTGDGDYTAEVQKVIAKSKFASDIFLTGYFPHENLPELYSSADACVFPAVAEGIGLPVIEAQASGIPVACAKAGALPEFTGDSAVFFDPDNTEDLAELINTLVTDEKVRQSLIKTGIDWTDRFSWEKTAQKTIELILN